MKSLYKLTKLTVLLAALCLLATKSNAAILAGWDTHTNSGYGASPLPVTVSAPNLTVVGLTRGSGVATTGTAATRAWGGVNWTNATEAAAITANQFVTFSFTANTGYLVSFGSVSQFNYRRSSTGPTTGELQYQIGSAGFIDAASISYTVSASGGAALSPIDLSGISDLQNVPAGTVVTFRIVNYLGTGSAGSWYVFDVANTTANDFEIQGAVNPVPTGAPPGNVVLTPTNAVVNANDSITFNVTATGDAPTYFWYKETPAGTNLISGATASTLTLSSLTAADTAQYQVVLTNANGRATSSVATLTVNDPGILVQPSNITNVLNDLDLFSATAVSSQESQLYWYYNGTLITNSDYIAITNTLSFYVTNSPAATNLAGYYLVASNQFGMITSAVVTATIAKTPSVELARWDFNVTNSYTATNPIASFGVGTAVAVQNPAVSNFDFAAGAPFDPSQLVVGGTNLGWALTGFQTGISNKTAGFQFSVSTVGYTGLMLTWSERHSATASKYMRVQYTTNGVDFVDGDVVTFSDVAYAFYSSDLSTKPGVNNNPNFGFRLVAEHEDTAIGSTNAAYVGTSSAFSTGGTIRVDLMTLFGNTPGAVTPIPLRIQRVGANTVLSWTDPSAVFSLQSAPKVTGVFTNIPGATNPYTNPATGGQLFFRLKSN